MNDRRDLGRVSIVLALIVAAVALLATAQVVFLAADRSAPPPTPQAATIDIPSAMPLSAAGEAAAEAASSTANAWFPLDGPTIAGGQVRGLTVHPAVSGTIYAALQPVGGGWDIPSVVYESTNSGASWTAVYTIPTGARVLAVTGTVIYAGSYNRDGASLGPVLHRSIDGGLNWTVPISFADGIIRELSIHPTVTQTAAAGGGDWLSHTASLYRTNDAGSTWTEVFSYTKVGWFPTVNATLIHPTHPITWFLSHDGDVEGGAGAYVYRSTDGGTNWGEVYTITGDYVTSLVANPVTPTIIYAATDSNNLHRSTDGGVSWTAVITDGSAGTQLVLEPPNTLYARIQWSWEVRKSTDGGDTWSTAGWSLGNVDRLAIDLGPTPAALYAGQGDWNPGGVSKSTDGGSSWSGVNNGIETLVLPNDIDSDPQNPDNLFAAAGWGGGFRSDDGGGTWTEPSGLGNGVNEFAINPADSNIAFSGVSDCSRGALLRSTDGGGSFVPVYTATHIISDCSGGSAHVYGLAVAPSVSSTVYGVGADEVSWQPERAVIIRSLDVGLSWSKVFTLSGESGFHLVAIDPTDDDIVFAGGYDCTGGPCIGAVYRTTDGGGNWTLVLTSTTEVSSIIFDSGIKDSLYVADYDYQVFKSSDGGDNWSVVRCPPWGTCSNSGPSGGLMAADPHWSDRIYLSGWNYTAESLDGGQTWSDWSDPLNQDMPAAAFTAFAVDNGSVTQTLYGGYLGVWAYRRETPYPFTAVVTDTMTGVSRGSVAWGDYDNDGDLDILLTGYDDNIRHAKVYRNDGNDIFVTAVTTDTLTGVNVSSVAWGDYDNDGDLDILLTGYTGSSPVSKVYRNDGGDVFTDISAPLTDVYKSSVAWGDYDSDGDLDILLTGNNGISYTTEIYRNDGSDSFTGIGASPEGVEVGSVAWGDYDNDGDLDILLTGNSSSGLVSKVYRNDGLDTFTDISAPLTGVNYSSAAWGDYDNDGDLDILLTGDSDGPYISAVYRNDGGDTFTDINAGLTNVIEGSAEWGDYDNDGDLDILLTGFKGAGEGVATVYRNDGSDTFVEMATPSMLNVYISSGVWGDYDNDSDLDVLIIGYHNAGGSDSYTARVYRNNSNTSNSVPAAPSNLIAQKEEDTVQLSWSAPPPTATTPITGLTYNLYVGTSPGEMDTATSMAFTSPISDGLRLLPAIGNAQHGLTATLTGLAEGTYYWSVQAVDHTFAGSPFAADETFTITYAFTPVVTDTLDNVYNSSVAWGDYDSDGDLDILLTGNSSSGRLSRVYRNDGSDTFTDISVSLTGVSFSSVVWGDYDNDGDLDILLTGWDGSTRHAKIYRNDGGDVFTDISVSLTGVSQGSIAWGDYDNDGDLDILLTGNDTGGSAISKVYRNDGGDVFTDISTTITGVYSSSAVWGDYDNDGDLDILLTGWTVFDHVSKVYRNDGGDTFTDISAGLTGVEQGSAEWGDYDNDGDLDILLTGYSSSGRISRVYRNDGSDTFTDISVSLTGVSFSSVVWGDYDNDGDLDILLTGWTGLDHVSKVYRNDGGDAFTDISAILVNVSQGSAAWGDYDNDGDLDILLTGLSDSGRTSRIYRNNTTTTNAVPTAPSSLSAQTDGDTVALSWSAPPPTATTPITGLTYNLYVGTAPGMVDVVPPMAFTVTDPLTNGLRLLPALGNGQHGLTATLTGLAEGTYYWSVQAVDHTFAGSPFAAEGTFTITYPFTAVVTDTFPGVQLGSVAWGDYDSDGDLDVLLTGLDTLSAPVARVYRNEGGSTFTPAVTDTLQGVYYSAVAWGDYDNDGDLDILLTGYFGGRVTNIYRNDGNDTFTDISAGLTAVHAGSVAWGDYDNDGDLDVLLTGYTGSAPTSHVYRNDGSDTFTDIGASLTGVYISSAAWGDYDGDDDLDILLTGYTGSIYVSKIYRNDGLDTFTDIGAPLTDVYAGSASWGDYDNDGDLDILLTGRYYDGPTMRFVSRVYRNDGSDTFVTAVTTDTLTGVEESSAEWGDYDNDGDLDILLSGCTAWGTTSCTGFATQVYRNDGSDVFVTVDTADTLTGVDRSSAVWGDYDGDGDLDIILTGRDSDLNLTAKIYRNNTAIANTIPTAPSNLSAQTEEDSVSLSWSAPPPTSTTPITGLTYNLYVGTAPGQVDVASPMAFTVPISDGLRLLPALGNTQHGLTATLTGLTEGTYYWSVQAMDHTFAGSPFAIESSFSITYPFTAAVTDTLMSVEDGSVAWGDYDNDGDLDVLLTGWTGSIPVSKVYRNNGADTFTDIGASLTAVYHSSVAWGDYDNDGDLDILLTGYYNDGSNHMVAKVYRNDGSDTFTDISASLTGVYVSSVAWGDYDNDGDLDILLTGADSTITPISKVYRNDGGNTFTDISAPLTGVYYSSVAWGDYDNDGDLDILLNGFNGSYISEVYRNDGSDTFTDISATLTGASNGAVAWGDYDNDGDLDILLVGCPSGGCATRISNVYRNDGADTFIDIGASLAAIGTSSGHSSVAWGDYDNDGDLDILLAGNTGSGLVSSVYRNDDSDTFTAAVENTLTDVHDSSVAWGDYDNDGDLDILLTGYDGGSRVAMIYRNNTTTDNSIPTAPSGLSALTSEDTVDLRWSSPPPTSTTPITGLTYNLYIGTSPGQVDTATPMAFTAPISDGLRQIPALGNAQLGLTATLTGLAEGTYYWSAQAVDHTFAGSPFAAEESFTITYAFTPVVTDTLTGVEHGSVAWGDYDNDGDLDVLLTGYAGSVPVSKVYRNDGSNTFTDIGASLTAVRYSSVAWGDYDNDGDLDILLTGYFYDGSNHFVAKVYRNDGSDTFTDIGASLTGVYVSSVAWGDYDNDGDLDILLSGSDTASSTSVSKVYRNDGGDTFTDISAPLTGVYYSSVAWGDYDNDGDLDILLTGFNGGYVTEVYRNDGSDIFTDISASLVGVSNGSVAWGDYDNDGDLDILLAGCPTGGCATRVSIVYRNDGSDNFTDIGAPLVPIGTSGGCSSVAWGDFDNDGDLDILLTGHTGSSYASKVYRNDGSDTFTDINTQLTGVYDSSVAWGDYDNDGDLDILLAGVTYGSNRVATIYRNNTTTANTVPTAPTSLSAQTEEDMVDLSWSAPPPTATTPITGLTYNLYVGTAPGQVDTASPMAFTAPVSGGLRLIPALGNAQHGLTATLTGLAEGTYYWSAQAVDHTFAGSPFAVESSFTITYAFSPVITDQLSGVSSSSVAWGDYDNDSDLDILLTGHDDSAEVSIVFRNDGTDTFAVTGVTLVDVEAGDVAWGDYDNDGDLDILLTGYYWNGSSNVIAEVYRNDGSDIFTGISASLTGVSASSVAWGDYDNDGDLDILLTGRTVGGTHHSKVYRNDGNDTFTDISAALVNVSQGSAVWGDYDSDGDLDILLTGWDGGARRAVVYRNDGLDTFANIGASLTAVDVSSAVWGDYDNDGDLDILLSGCVVSAGPCTSRTSKVYRNDGGDAFTDIAAPLTAVAQSSVAWGDYDNDGDLDILLTGEAAGGQISRVYRNNGSDTFVDIDTHLTGVSSGSVAWGDYDHDGDLDILLTGYDGSNRVATVYRNNTTATNAVPGAPFGLNSQTEADSVDLSWSAPSPTSTTPITGLTYNLYVGTAPGQVDAASPMAFTAPISDGLRLIPALGNAQHGLTATLTGLTEGAYYWSVQAVDHTFTGSPFASEGRFFIGPPFTEVVSGEGELAAMYTNGVAWGDYDSDGDLDVLHSGTTTGGDDYTRLYRNDGADTFVDIGVLADVSGPGAWGDYDNDGDLDILLQGLEESGRVARVYRNDGGGSFVTAVTTDTLLGVYGGSAAWGDYDNDGDLDILMTGQAEGLSRTARVYRNDGGDTFVTVVTTDTLTGVSSSSAEWGDYDNDGDLDILLTGYAGPGKIVTAVYRNDGADTFVTAVTTDTLTGVYGNSSSAWGDYDNDGDLDILITGWNGSEEVATVYRNEGGDTFVTAVTTDTLVGVQDGAVAWGDYDNDGDLDMLFTGDTGDVITPTIYRNDGGDVFTAAITDALPGVYASAVAWGDYDNDGDLDIFFAGNDIDELPFAALYRNNTLNTNALPAAPGGLSALTAGDTVELSWTAPPPTSTTPITGLTYNLYVGTAPGQIDVMPPMALTAPVSNGLRLLPAMGNAQHGLSATLVLTDGTYYWSVQAVDHTFAGSPFAGEGQFTILSNQAPIAAAGADQPVDTGALVILDGSGSSDPDGDLPLTFGWVQTGGPPVTFNGALTATTFTAPGDPGVLTFTLTVTDALGMPSAPDQVVITVGNQAPIADAGTDQSVGTSAVVELDGSGSSDPDGDLPLTFGWAQVGGPGVTFNSTLSITTFTAPGAATVLTFTLTVTDSFGLPSIPDQVTITVSDYQVYLPLVLRNY